jgi:hypothetical protein
MRHKLTVTRATIPDELDVHSVSLRSRMIVDIQCVTVQYHTRPRCGYQ